MRFLKGLLVTLVTFYLVASVLVFFFQESLIFHPRPRPISHSYGAYAETWINVEDDVRLNAITVPAYLDKKAEGVILYLHGNVGDNGRSLPQTRSLTDLGYDLFLVDYRGYGKSEGEISAEAHMTEDLQFVYDHLVQEYGEENILLVGYSLGTGPSAYLAANNEPKGVLLVAPYTSLTDMKNQFFWMFPDFLMKYAANNKYNLENSTVPVSIIHGTEDELIPFSMAEALAAVDPERVKLVPVPGGSHRGAIFSESVRPVVKSLMQSLR